MKDSQPGDSLPVAGDKYIKVNNERFSTDCSDWLCPG